MKVPQFMPYIGKEEYKEIKDCFDSEWYTEGKKSRQFCEELKKIIGCRYAVLAPNGTLAIYLALRALGIGRDDEVIVPDFTFIASATAIEMTGAQPVFVDIRKETLQIDVDDCQRVLTKKTKAIMPVHIYGASCDMTKIMHFARRNKLKVIEDAAQALGVKWGNGSCGNFGDISSFSFFIDKTLTTIEGGLVTTNDEKAYKKLLFLRNQGRLSRGTFIHPEIGYNFRMTDLQAAIGLAQIKKLPEIISRKNNIYKRYFTNLRDLPQIEILKPAAAVDPFIPFRTVIRIKTETSKRLMEYMSKKNIEPRTFFYPLHKQPCFKNFVKEDERYNDKYFLNSIAAYDHGVCLPSYASLDEPKIDYVCGVIKEYFNKQQGC